MARCGPSECSWHTQGKREGYGRELLGVPRIHRRTGTERLWCARPLQARRFVQLGSLTTAQRFLGFIERSRKLVNERLGRWNIGVDIARAADMEDDRRATKAARGRLKRPAVGFAENDAGIEVGLGRHIDHPGSPMLAVTIAATNEAPQRMPKTR